MLKRYMIAGMVYGSCAFALSSPTQAFGISAPSLPSIPSVGSLGNTAIGVVSAIPGVANATAKFVPLYTWMSPEVLLAWYYGYKGQNTNIIVVDDFISQLKIKGTLGMPGDYKTLHHGEWTYLEAKMIALSATMTGVQIGMPGAVELKSGLNVINLSYGIMRKGNYNPALSLGSQTKSIVSYAQNGTAVVVQAAGNERIAVDARNSSGEIDLLSYSLIGKKSAIFVGALNKNGNVLDRAQLASYSNIAGTNTTIQKQFLVVGVNSDTTNLSGTSFAAPIISGYAAVLGSKFKNATATEISNQLLNTARRDTVKNYSADIYGRGEASLSRALAPVSIR